MQAPPPVAQTAEELTLISFARSTLNLLTFWPALRIAVSQGWGGEAGRTHLAEDLVDLFYTTATEANSATTTSNAVVLPELDDIEEVILHVISHDFSLTLEDGSERLVARDLHKLWKECLARSALGGVAGEGDEGLKEKFEAAAEKARLEDGVRRYEAKREGVSDDEDSEDGSDMDDDDEDDEMDGGEASSKQKDEPVIDEDGFQMVGKKGR